MYCQILLDTTFLYPIFLNLISIRSKRFEPQILLTLIVYKTQYRFGPKKCFDSKFGLKPKKMCMKYIWTKSISESTIGFSAMLKKAAPVEVLGGGEQLRNFTGGGQLCYFKGGGGNSVSLGWRGGGWVCLYKFPCFPNSQCYDYD